MCNTTIQTAQAEWEAEQQRVPQRIEFEVNGDFVKSLPEILSNIAEIKSWCEARTQIDRNRILTTTEDFEDAKARCATYNKIMDAIDAKKKDVKKAYNEPYEKFERAIKETIAVLKDAKDHLWEQVKEAEEKIRADKLDKLQTYWEETLDRKITQYRKFTAIADTKWLNKGTKFTTAFDEMDKQFAHIATILDAIHALNSEFEIALLEYYKEGHDFGEVLGYNRRLQIQKSARETAKAETQANTQNEAEQGGQAQQTAQSDENEEVFPVVFKVTATRAQIRALGAYLRENGIAFEQAEWTAKK